MYLQGTLFINELGSDTNNVYLGTLKRINLSFKQVWKFVGKQSKSGRILAFTWHSTTLIH